MWLTVSYRFHSMLDGFIDPIRVFAKLLKPQFCQFREQGYSSVIHVDATRLVDYTYAECIDNLLATLECP